MSDLAPFVAAALRDRVVLEQQEEIEKLCEELEEAKRVAELVRANREADASIALRGISARSLFCAVAKPRRRDRRPVLVYAVDHINISESMVLEDVDCSGNGFHKLHRCSIADLAEANLFLNGEDLGSFGSQQIRFYGVLQSKESTRSVEDVEPLRVRDLDGSLRLEQGYFEARVFAEDIPVGYSFGLSSVSTKKLLDFVLREHPAHCSWTDTKLETRRVSLNKMIDFFGGGTEVVFARACAHMGGWDTEDEDFDLNGGSDGESDDESDGVSLE